MARTYRWEAERAAWLRERARAGTSRARRADVLTRAAWRHKRDASGVSASVSQEIPKPAIWRWTHGPGGEPRRRVLVAAAALVLVPLAGAGVVAGKGAYLALERWVAPRVGRLWWWPPLVAAGALWLVRSLLTDWPVLGVSLALTNRFPLDLVSVGGWAGWASLQAVVALVALAHQIHAWGWQGVPRGAVATPAKNKDGSWRVAPEAELLVFDVYGAQKTEGQT